MMASWAGRIMNYSPCPNKPCQEDINELLDMLKDLGFLIPVTPNAGS